jgi:transcriptional regulator with XRE-family HTH domain
MLQPGQARLTAGEVVRLLREERLSRHWSAYRLSKKSGVSQQMIGYMEKGLRTPSLEILLRISQALDVNLSALLKQAGKTCRR